MLQNLAKEPSSKQNININHQYNIRSVQTKCFFYIKIHLPTKDEEPSSVDFLDADKSYFMIQDKLGKKRRIKQKRETFRSLEKLATDHSG